MKKNLSDKKVWISSIEMPDPSVREYCWWRWINRHSLEGAFENKRKIMSPFYVWPITPPHKINNWYFLSITTIIIPYIPLENPSIAIDIICIVVRHIILTSIIYVLMMIDISCDKNPTIKQHYKIESLYKEYKNIMTFNIWPKCRIIYFSKTCFRIWCKYGGFLFTFNLPDKRLYLQWILRNECLL